MWPHPPSFLCINGLQFVPYSLVCDFRVDCGDGSDENFCQYLPCDIPRQYECLNKQVSIHDILLLDDKIVI